MEAARRKRCYIRVDGREVKLVDAPDHPQDLRVLLDAGVAAGAARYTAVRVDVREDGGGDVEAADLPLPSHQEAACWTALQVECTISSAALTAVPPGGVEVEAEHRQRSRSLHAHSDT